MDPSRASRDSFDGEVVEVTAVRALRLRLNAINVTPQSARRTGSENTSEPSNQPDSPAAVFPKRAKIAHASKETLIFVET
jgi:hypothetical protein